MTREEIEKRVLSYSGSDKYGNPMNAEYYDAFIDGAEWADAHQPSQWISVEDRLPEINQVVLTLGSEKNDADVRLLFRGDVSGNFVCIDYDEITHWMPIPELLKRGEK